MQFLRINATSLYPITWFCSSKFRKNRYVKCKAVNSEGHIAPAMLKSLSYLESAATLNERSFLFCGQMYGLMQLFITARARSGWQQSARYPGCSLIQEVRQICQYYFYPLIRIINNTSIINTTNVQYANIVFQQKNVQGSYITKIHSFTLISRATSS